MAHLLQVLACLSGKDATVYSRNKTLGKPKAMDGWIEYYLQNCGIVHSKTHHLLVQAIAPELGNSDLGVKELAVMLNVSRRQLYRDIHTLLDKPVGQWIRELRLYKAKWLIRQERVTSLEELAQKVGFKSPAYFRKVYGDFFDTNLAGHFPTKATLNLSKRLHERA